MNNDIHPPSDSLEALLRAAGDYVQVSRDLRPAVLEEAREVRSDRHARGQVLALSACSLLVAIVVQWANARHANRPAPTREHLLTADGAQLLALAQTPVVKNEAAMPWALVDLFCALRQQQAAALGDSSAAK